MSSWESNNHDAGLLSRLQQARDAARNRGRVSGVIEQSREKVRSIEQTLSCFDKELGVRGGMERTAMQDVAYYNKVTENSREMIKESLNKIRAPISTLESSGSQPASTRQERYAELEKQISSLQASSASALRNHQLLSHNIKKSLGSSGVMASSTPPLSSTLPQASEQPISSILRRTEELQRKLKDHSEQNRLSRAALQNTSIDSRDSSTDVQPVVEEKYIPVEGGHRSGYNGQPQSQSQSQSQPQQVEEDISTREGSPISINSTDISLRMERERQDKLWARLSKSSQTQNGTFRRDLDRLLSLREEFLAEERRLAMCELGLLLEKRIFKDKLTRIRNYANNRAGEINRNGPNYNEGILLDAVCNVIKTDIPPRNRRGYTAEG